MRCSRTLSCALAALAALASDRVAAAEGDVFKARLSPVPVESSTLAGITGSGSATATLNARTLSVSGSFQGLQSPATMAQLHLGPKGVRGPVLFELTVTKAISGTLGGTFTLSAEQVEALKRSRMYIEIHSEKAPEGNLWGWLLQP
jgi:hypothetical protein